MRVDEYATYDGLGLGQLIRDGDVTPRELVEIAYQAIEQTNGDLNFLVGETREQAEQGISSCSSDIDVNTVFAGVPTLIKDVGPTAAGIMQESGSALAAGLVPSSDSEFITRIRNAGLIFTGRSTTPEFGMALTTEPRMQGATRNPWDLERSTGGSSGGAAAAVAAGVVPIALAGDTAGSIRVPAHCCGLFGLKPSRGRNPVGPQLGESGAGLTCAHVITRSVRDSAAVLDATAGPDVGCRYSAPPPSMSFTEAVERPKTGLRIAYSTRNCFGAQVNAEIKSAVEQAARLCGELGHAVEEADPAFDAEMLLDVFDVISSAGMQYIIEYLEQVTGRAAGRQNLEGTTLAFLERGRQVSGAEYLGGLSKMNTISRDVGRFFVDYDVLITPVFSDVAPMLGTISVDKETPDLKQYTREVFQLGAFTPQYNITGQPAMSVPLYHSYQGQSDQGLPIGVQFASRYYDEETLFALAGQLEQALPWCGRQAPFSVFNRP